MRKHRVEYCPRNGCGMPNGAAPPTCIATCKNCANKQEHFYKVCKKCGYCISCGRIIKKLYEKENK